MFVYSENGKTSWNSKILVSDVMVFPLKVPLQKKLQMICWKWFAKEISFYTKRSSVLIYHSSKFAKKTEIYKDRQIDRYIV